jgi:hypothetical protein
MRRHIRLLEICGNARANGDVVVEERVQKRKTAAIAKPTEMRVCGFMSRQVELVRMSLFSAFLQRKRR